MPDEVMTSNDPQPVPAVFNNPPAASPSGKLIVTPASQTMNAAQAAGHPVMKTTQGNYVVICVSEDDFNKFTQIGNATGWDLRIREIPICAVK